MSQKSVTLLILLITTLFCTSCKNNKLNAEMSLKGFGSCGLGQLAKPIAEDYQEYVRQLPTKEREQVYGFNIQGYYDGSGQHAVTIRIPLEGVWGMHLLIYDKNNKRIKTINYTDGRYGS